MEMQVTLGLPQSQDSAPWELLRLLFPALLGYGNGYSCVVYTSASCLCVWSFVDTQCVTQRCR